MYLLSVLFSAGCVCALGGLWGLTIWHFEKLSPGWAHWATSFLSIGLLLATVAGTLLAHLQR